MPAYQVWFTKVGTGVWNGNPSANPATGVGGIDLSAMAGLTMFATVQAAGGSGIICNFGATAFHGSVPAGFIGGWPAAGGGFTTLSPVTRNFGMTLTNGNLTATPGSGNGMVQSVDGHSTGAYYFEITNAGQSFFANFQGGGVGQDYSAGGLPADWITNCAFNLSSNLGGAAVSGGAFNTFQASIQAIGSTVASNVFQYVTGDVIGVAVFLSSNVPPPTAEAGMADFWFGTTPGFFDLSQASNRRKFIDANGCPVYLGPQGERPFNSLPPMFLTATPSSAAAFATNNGTGGGFSNGASLSLTPSSPCCSEFVTDNFNVPLGADPQVRLSVSDDGGRTWNLVTKNRSLGRLGKYLTRLRWLKMGQFRQRVVKIEITDPVKRRFVGFYADLDEGMG